MKIALVDDSAEDLQRLRDMMAEALAAHGIADGQIHCFAGSDAFLAQWEAGSFDLILLDIYIDSRSGIDVAQKIRQDDQTAALAFCTSSNDFAAESYAVDARYYLLKPVTLAALGTMLQRINIGRIAANSVIQLPDGYRFLRRKLIYTNYVNHLVTFYIQDQEPHSTYITQAEVEKILDHSCFYPVNKGSIINFDMVKRVNPDSFLMKDGSTVHISRRRYKNTKEAFTKFHFQKLREEAEG